MNSDLLKVIKFEGNDCSLVWKHPEVDFNFYEGKNDLESSLNI